MSIVREEIVTLDVGNRERQHSRGCRGDLEAVITAIIEQEKSRRTPIEYELQFYKLHID